ncbi:endonuclease/exonuclease/phosphatase family protein [Streptomyces sp. NPDC014983]|uniref:endonuclease/exonuclease/phosphatase family protein n=1 Tax=Streptomyces sp. NPDC014983 TaxID=3364933 RepID=UPI003702853E
MATHELRAITYNLLTGGLDAGDDTRLRAQTEMLAHLTPDILSLQECTGWTNRHLCQVADALGMVPVGMARSRVRRVPDPYNGTALLIRDSSVRLMDWWIVGEGDFHHALIRAQLRPVAAGSDPSSDFTVFATHFDWSSGAARLDEARMLTDYGGPFPGAPRGALLLGDLNTPDRHPDWSLVPRNLHSRYRLVSPDGHFGRADRRAVQVLLESGWQDPQMLFGDPEAASVGYYYPNEPVLLRLDYTLVSGLVVTSYAIYDTPAARGLSDHLPVVLDVDVMAGAPAAGLTVEPEGKSRV